MIGFGRGDNMGVIITSGDKYTTKDTTISWTLDAGRTQTAYRLEWKLKNDSSWNFLTKNLGSTQSASLASIYNAAEYSGYAFKEIWYRVRVWTRNDLDSTNYLTDSYEATEEVSPAYNLIFKPTSVSNLNTPGVTYPLFPDGNITTAAKVNTSVGQAPVVPNGHALSSNLKVNKGSYYGTVGKSNPSFVATGVGSSGYYEKYEHKGIRDITYSDASAPCTAYNYVYGYRQATYQYYDYSSLEYAPWLSSRYYYTIHHNYYDCYYYKQDTYSYDNWNYSSRGHYTCPTSSDGYHYTYWWRIPIYAYNYYYYAATYGFTMEWTTPYSNGSYNYKVENCNYYDTVYAYNTSYVSAF